MKTSNALLDESTMDVVCQECGDAVSNVSEAMKRTLKSFGQIVRSEQRKAFMLACRNCNANREVVLDYNNKTLCKTCHEPVTVHPAFLLAIENAGTGLEKIDTRKEAKAKKTTTKRKRTQKVTKKSQKEE